MNIIITHPGTAHLDDFLSTCLVIYKMGDIEEVHRKEPTREEINDSSIWKLDVGNKHDPDMKCFDHHQIVMDDCTLSLLLKNWELWEKAVKVYNWLKIAVAKDTKGPKEVIKLLNISYTALGSLDSFIERTILNLFQKREIIKKGSVIFSLMKVIGKQFFMLIDEYYKTIKAIERKIEFKRIKGVIVVFCYKNVKHSNMLVRILNEKKKEMWQDERGGIAVYPNNRPHGTIALRRYNDDKRVDFSKISKYEKVNYAHPQGFFVSLEPMSDYELEQYIEDAIKGNQESLY